MVSSVDIKMKSRIHPSFGVLRRPQRLVLLLNTTIFLLTAQRQYYFLVIYFSLVMIL